MIWRACERFNINPATWDDLDIETQAHLLAYNNIRVDEEMEILNATLRSSI